MNNYVVVDRKVENEALAWAKEFCPSYITSDYHMVGYNSYDIGKFEFYFSDPKDMTAFKLKWG